MTWSATSRVPRSHEQARASYDRLSRWYDLFEEPFERPMRRRALRMLRPVAGETILEVGFGTGHDLVALARAVGSAGHVWGIDLSPGMRRVAERRLRASGMADRVELWTADAVAMPYDDGSVDAILMSFTLELFDSPEVPGVLTECRRALRGEGRLCVTALSQRARPGLGTRLYVRAHALLPGVIDCRPIPLRAAVEETGFEIRDIAVGSLWGLAVDAVLAAPLPLSASASSTRAAG
jgi:demethylmenaquinone methyltransferase/2-methoxy-6-polyprenyl-1,4-benzoquinol methylase